MPATALRCRACAAEDALEAVGTWLSLELPWACVNVGLRAYYAEGLLARTSGVFGETAAGVTLGALREGARRGEVGGHDRVVLLVTGDGLKTPGPVAERLRPVEIEPEADELLARLRPA